MFFSCVYSRAALEASFLTSVGLFVVEPFAAVIVKQLLFFGEPKAQEDIGPHQPDAPRKASRNLCLKPGCCCAELFHLLFSGEISFLRLEFCRILDFLQQLLIRDIKLGVGHQAVPGVGHVGDVGSDPGVTLLDGLRLKESGNLVSIV